MSWKRSGRLCVSHRHGGMRSVQRRLQSNPIRLISPTKLIFKPNNYGHYFEQISHQLKDIWRLNTVILCKKSNSIYFGFPKKCLSFIFQFSQADKSFISFLVSMSQICLCFWNCYVLIAVFVLLCLEGCSIYTSHLAEMNKIRDCLKKN